jgi:hypothetical protein
MALLKINKSIHYVDDLCLTYQLQQKSKFDEKSFLIHQYRLCIPDIIFISLNQIFHDNLEYIFKNG